MTELTYAYGFTRIRNVCLHSECFFSEFDSWHRRWWLGLRMEDRTSCISCPLLLALGGRTVDLRMAWL